MTDLAGVEVAARAGADALDSRLAAARGAAAGGKLEEAGQAFETLLATILVREMGRTLSDGFFGSGAGADTFNGWMEEHLGAALAESRALGLAEAVRASLLNKEAGGAGAAANGEEV